MPEASPSVAETGNIFASHVVDTKSSYGIEELAAEFPGHHTDWTIPEAFLCLVLSAAIADGTVSVEEREELIAIAHRSRTLKGMAQNDLAAANARILERRDDRPNWLEEACSSLPSDMHLSVFALCVDIALADGSLVKGEADYLEELLRNLHVSKEEGQAIVHVIALKNRY